MVVLVIQSQVQLYRTAEEHEHRGRPFYTMPIGYSEA